ncbi:MAG: aliphatic sulfonate transporter substrate-binding protein [Oscillospiraceae bacterium]|nr:aliphatic sulfonate transporter substrate-binding protein [Oscillospiraceae bacterium]
MKKKSVKKVSLLISAVLALSVFATGCGTTGKTSPGTDSNASTAAANLPKEIRLGYFQSPNGELLAKGQKLLEKKFPGVTIKYTKFDIGRDVNTAMAGGSLDIATIGTPPGTSGLVNELPYKIYYLHDIIGASEALVVKKSAGINSIQDIKGKKIAAPFGSTSHFSLLSALKQNNIAEKDLTILDMQAPDILAAWSRGDIDGAYVWQPAQQNLLDNDGKRIISSKEVAEKGAITGEFGIVSNDFANKYPEVVKAYIEILNQATKEYRTGTDEVVNILSAELGLSKDATKEAMSQIVVLDSADQTKQEYLGTTEKPGNLPQLLKDTSDFLLSQKSVTKSPDLDFFKGKVLTDLYK